MMIKCNPLSSGLLVALLSLPLVVSGEQIQLAAGHPQSHTVVPGDTLWGIAGRFLAKPWRWGEVWRANPQVENPHLIYPGDTIRLVMGGEGAALELDGGKRVVRLTPTIRVSEIDQAIPTIPNEVVRSFLTRTRVIDELQLEEAGYVLSPVGEHLLTSSGDLIHARGIGEEDGRDFVILRPGKSYSDPEMGVIGREGVYVGEARLREHADPDGEYAGISTLQVVRSTRGIQNGDRLLPTGEEEIERNFSPRPAPYELDGLIIDVVDGLSQIGQFQVVVLNRGRDHRLMVGDVVAVMQRGAVVRDPMTEGLGDQPVSLPPQRAALALVFQAYDQLSYALVMNAERALHVGDMVRSPER